MAMKVTVVVILALCVLGQALTPSSFLTTPDQKRLQSVFEAAAPYVDAASAQYSILGLKLLGAAVPNAQNACKGLSKIIDASSVASIYSASAAAKAIGNCKIDIPEFKATLSEAIKDDSTPQDISMAFLAQKNLGIATDDKAVSKALLAALKADESIVSHGYAFLAAAELSGDVSKFVDNVEDVIAQADEVDDKYLQFEGGLYVTALVVDGAYKLAEKTKKAPTISQDKVIKFANYFMSRKHVHQLKSAYHFMSVIKTLASNNFHVPVAVSLASPVAVTQAMPSVKVQVTDLLGASLGEMSVTADSARHLGDDAVVLSRKQLTQDKTDKSMFELNFLDAKPAKGFYKLNLNVAPKKADQRLIGTSGAEHERAVCILDNKVEVKVTTKVAVQNVEIGVADKDQSTAHKSTKLAYPNKAASALEADHHQKVLMSFQLKDQSSGGLMEAHQTFVRLTNLATKQEIIFVAEADASLTNKFDLDVGASAKEFGSVSGKYSMELIVGDAVIENPFSWALADIKLSFPDSGPAKADNMGQYAKKPEIKHKFAVPEKRPPSGVSLAFTGLVLVPLVVLAALWMKIGINMGNFPMTLSSIGFHVCLAGIFGLYYMYWTQLNMFATLKYLGIIAVPTFFFGNRLLSGLAAKSSLVLRVPMVQTGAPTSGHVARGARGRQHKK